jgi:hypothetical protein
VLEQVTNGVAVRMMLLYLLIGGPPPELPGETPVTGAVPKDTTHAAD